MKTYSKTLELADYDRMMEQEVVQGARDLLGAQGPPADYEHRAWEYGLMLNALRENLTRTVLDVGGNGSIFAPAAALLGMNVLQIDPSPTIRNAEAQAARIELALPYLQMDFFDYEQGRTFDAVVCISTLEHVLNDVAFFEKLLSFVRPGGLLAMTVDFHPSGRACVGAHLRTYSNANLRALIKIAEEKKFALFGGDCDYTYEEAHVYGKYTFASLVMRRKGEVNMKDFDRCVKIEGCPSLWMIKGKSRLAFTSWEAYVAAGEPAIEVVTQEELDRYKIVGYFRRRKPAK